MIIHWMGGWTHEENNEISEFAFMSGRHQAYNSILMHMKACHGMPADEWCQHLYQMVERNTADAEARVMELLEDTDE